MTHPDLSEQMMDRLIDAGNQALNDYYHDRACACSMWPTACVTQRIAPGIWDTNAFAIALPAIIAEYQKGEQPPAHPNVAGLEHLLTLGIYRAPDEDPEVVRVTFERAPWMSPGTAREILTQGAELLDQHMRQAGETP